MEGIRFVVDDNGKKVAVLIDLARHGQMWETTTFLPRSARTTSACPTSP
jgi:hypothetical protein